MLPLLYVVGDSISIQYSPYLKKFLENNFAYDRKRGPLGNIDLASGTTGANGGDSSMVLEYFRALQAKDFKADIFLLNCGLHDIKRYDGKLQIEPEEYRANLQEILPLWRTMTDFPVWIRTTPVDDAQHAAHSSEFVRLASDLAAYNSIADEIMDAAGISSIDLHGFSSKLEKPYCDHVHFTEEVRALQAAFITGAVNALWSVN
jgi:hypothetical protein